MKNFSRGGDRDGGSRGSFGNGGFRGGSKGGFKGGWKGGDLGSFGGDDRPKVMHPATCSSCGKPCEVPFRPTGEKPVYCRDCFAGRAALGGERSSRRDERSENRPDSRPQFNNTPKPQTSSNNDELKRQIDSMNVKLDKLTNTIQNLAEKINKAEKIEVVPVVTAPVAKPKVTTKIEEKMVAKPKSKAKKVSKKK